MDAIRAFDAANEVLVSHDVGGAIFIHHLPCEVVCAVNVALLDDGVAITAVSFPWRVMNEDDLLNARLVKGELRGGAGWLNERMIPKELSAGTDVNGWHMDSSFKMGMKIP